MRNRNWFPASAYAPTYTVGLAVLICCTFFSPIADGSELRNTPVVRAVQGARGSVVNIRGEKTILPRGPQLNVPDPVRRVNGMGTGVVIDPRGYIVTNYHVVAGVRQIQVTPADGNMLIAQLVARDSETDLAIIKVDSPKKLPVINIGTSADLMPGEPVIAIGNAYGYEHTVTEGIVSALHRSVQVSDAQHYGDLIQTSASINPGNSGGPLLNIDGEMIGVNVAVRAGAQGIGFAIPADKAMAAVTKLLAEETAREVWHGMALTVGRETSAEGLTVAAVEKKSPAAQGGLKAGDVITAVNNTKIHRKLDFYRAMLGCKAGTKVQLAVRRGGKQMAVRFRVEAGRSQYRCQADPAWQVLGLELETIATDEFRRDYQTRYRGGLRVKKVRLDSPADEQGIRPGDVLVGMHVWETISLQNVSYILARPDFAELNPVKFFILRDNETLYGYLTVAAKTAPRQ